jgi:hypothetical protein
VLANARIHHHLRSLRLYINPHMFYGRSCQRFGGQMLAVDGRACVCPYPPPLVILGIRPKPYRFHGRSDQIFGGQILVVDVRACECPYPPPLVILGTPRPHGPFSFLRCALRASKLCLDCNAREKEAPSLDCISVLPLPMDCPAYNVWVRGQYTAQPRSGP